MKYLHAFLLALLVVLLVPAVAAAGTPVGPDTGAESLFTLGPFTVSALLGTIIPLITGLVTKVSTSSAVKAITTAALSIVAAAVNVSMTDSGGAVISESTAQAAVLTFIVAIATYYGFWKPTHTSDVAQRLLVTDQPRGEAD